MQLFKPSKYFKIEFIFFIVYFFVFRILTDFEYNFWERHVTGVSWQDVEYDLIYGTSSLLIFIFFYQMIRNYLRDGKLGRLLVYVLLFLVAYSLFGKFVSYMYANWSWLTAETRRLSLAQFKSKSIGYSLAYMFREFLAFSFLAYFIHSLEQNEKMKALKEQQLLSELAYLKAQLQPHFFFNTLNNIYALALKQSKDTAPIVAHLADMMRYILYESEHQFVPLAAEISFIKNYVEVEQIRYRSSISINLEVQGVTDQGQIAPLLLLPFIENAFKHGVQEEEGDGFVTIVVCKTEDELTLEVSNSIAKATATTTGGIGLMNVQKRLAILYNGQHKLEVQNNQNVYQVSLTLQL